MNTLLCETFQNRENYHTSSILVAQVWEPPNIPKSNSVANTGEHEINLLSPFISSIHNNCFNNGHLLDKLSLTFARSPKRLFFFRHFEEKDATDSTFTNSSSTLKFPCRSSRVYVSARFRNKLVTRLSACQSVLITRRILDILYLPQHGNQHKPVH